MQTLKGHRGAGERDGSILVNRIWCSGLVMRDGYEHLRQKQYGASHAGASSARCRVFTESELAWPRTYCARRHSLTSVGWAVAAIAVFRIETLPSRARPTLYLRAS